MTAAQSEWWGKYLAPLVGATITDAVGKAQDDGFGEEVWPTLTVRTKDGEEFDLEVSQDEEGNGPGFLFGLPTPS